MDINNLLSRRQLTYIIGFLVLLFTIFIVVTLIGRIGKTQVTVVVLPEDTKVSINGKESSPGEHYLKPGNYTFTAKRELFNDVSQTFTVGKKSTTISLMPTATSDEAIKWLADHPSVQSKREALADSENQKKGEQQQEKYPLMKQLPVVYDHGESSIGNGISSIKKGEPAVVVQDTSTDGRKTAIEWIREMGYDPADYIIEFQNFNNPLTNPY